MTKKNPKSPNIKKYKSAYIFFSQENTSKYKNLFPNLSLREIFKLIGEEWNKLNENEKEKYYELEKKSKENFEKNKEKNNYNYKKKTIDIKKPKRFRTAFMIYLHENKNKVDKKNCIESLKDLGQKWKKLNKQEKDIYIKKSENDKQRYKKDLMDYLKKKDKIDKRKKLNKSN